METLDFQSPIGIIEITGDEQGICSVLFAERQQLQFPKKPDTLATLIECQQQLEEYFQGTRFSFTIPFNNFS